jgi:hypothetical protein
MQSNSICKSSVQKNLHESSFSRPASPVNMGTVSALEQHNKTTLLESHPRGLPNVKRLQ